MKIGSYSIPDMRLFPRIEGYARIIYEAYGFNEATDDNSVAIALGHKTANSGAFLSKLADLRLYGLLEPHSIKATKLAEKLTYGTDKEKQDATNKAVLGIPLWKELYSKFGVELPESNFWLQLQNITGLSHLEAQKHADFVRKAYLDDISHIKAEKEEKDMTGQEGADKIDKFTSISDRQANIVAGLMREGAYDIAKSFIDFVKQKIGKEETTQEEG